MQRTPKRTGRPPLVEGEETVLRTLRWPRGLLEQLEEAVPPSRRAAFIRRAVERELMREQRRAARPGVE